MQLTMLVLNLLSAVVASLLGLTNFVFVQRRQAELFYALISMLALSTIIQYFKIRSDEWEDSRNKFSGTLRSRTASNKATPILKIGGGEPYKGPLRSPISQTYGALENITIGKLNNQAKHIPVIVLFGDGVYVWLDEGRVVISATVRDRDGEIIAQIEDNHWVVNPSKVSDFNFSDDALEIRNTQGDIVFQVRLKGNEASIAGVFHPGLFFPHDFPINPELAGQPVDRRHGPVILVPWIHEVDGRPYSLFKYPRSAHLGELVPIGPAPPVTPVTRTR